MIFSNFLLEREEETKTSGGGGVRHIQYNHLQPMRNILIQILHLHYTLQTKRYDLLFGIGGIDFVLQPHGRVEAVPPIHPKGRWNFRFCILSARVTSKEINIHFFFSLFCPLPCPIISLLSFGTSDVFRLLHSLIPCLARDYFSRV